MSSSHCFVYSANKYYVNIGLFLIIFTGILTNCITIIGSRHIRHSGLSVILAAVILIETGITNQTAMKTD